MSRWRTNLEHAAPGTEIEVDDRKMLPPDKGYREAVSKTYTSAFFGVHPPCNYKRTSQQSLDLTLAGTLLNDHRNIGNGTLAASRLSLDE